MLKQWPKGLPRLHVGDIHLPREVSGLYELAYNLWWSWSPEARRLFNRLDPRAWATYRNPVQVLLAVDRDHWRELLEDETFMGMYSLVIRKFERYLEGRASSWFAETYGSFDDSCVAYFCMEYGLHQSLALYSGGLGVLAGDHLKSASDLGVPLVGVGLLYLHGYFSQTIDADGRQQHIYPEYDFQRLPLRPAAGPTGRSVLVSVPFPDREIWAMVWIAQVGRVPLVLLDTDVPQNDSADRLITNILYTPGREMRLAQELVLGVGGVRAIEALGLQPRVWHLNEGHSALLQLERIRQTMKTRGRTFQEAVAEVRQQTVFTTHTPVPAGHEEFDRDLVERYVSPLLSESGVDLDRWLSLGSVDGDRAPSRFNLTALALRTSCRRNGVSKINAGVAKRMWAELVSDSLPPDEQLTWITNGVHPSSWIGPEIRELLARVFGERWFEFLNGPHAEAALARVADEEIWEAHMAQKQRLGRFLRARLRNQFSRHGLSPDELRALERMFDPAVLTLGFARRFATYKRAGLLFTDLDRLQQILSNPERPVQVVLSGKAHPADREGQELIQNIFKLSRSEGLQGKIFFVEDYDMRVGRMLVQGSDVWLNTPRPPLEASGTSGMKAAMNGALNCSVGDGWWPEAYDGENGWLLPSAAHDGENGELDATDAQALYRLLEEEIAPLFYERDQDGPPRRWIARMRHGMATIGRGFSSDRMVREYVERAYWPLAGGRQPSVEPDLVPERQLE